ncbi:MAG: aminotransferase class V-fold PLP-dependent enzyme [Candidatus Limnocylindrales bacterium]
MPRSSPFARHWALDPEVVFLNHGSFGACPIPVLETQRAWRDRLEAEPVRFMVDELEPALDAARQTIGAFLGADPDDLAFMHNATSGVNAVLRSLDFGPGDEILGADHEYNACLNAARYVAERAGARLAVAPLPFPVAGPGEIVERVLSAVTPRTRLALLSHITSPTAVVLPILELVRELSRRGIDVLVDAAHAPGNLAVDIAELEAAGLAYWTGNLHKWVCAPKGAAVLWVRRDRQAGIRPLTISHGANDARSDRSRFRLEFDWQGTDDPTAVLAAPTALEFIGGLLPGGWPAVRAYDHALALAGRDAVCRRLGVDAPVPNAMLGSMAAVVLRERTGEQTSRALSPLDADPIQLALMDRYRIQVPVLPWPTPWTPGFRPDMPRQRVVRLSAYLYNDAAEYDLLAEGLADVILGP